MLDLSLPLPLQLVVYNLYNSQIFTLAEQTKGPTKEGLEELKARQDAILNKIGSLQFRLNKVQRQENIPYDTSNISLQQFKELEIKQATIFEILLNIAGQIDKVASKQKLDLPATNDVKSIIFAMADYVEKRQKQSLTQLKELTEIANSIQSMELTQEIEEFIKIQEIEKKEDIDVDVGIDIDIDETSKKNEFFEFKSRKYDLELVSECLRVQCQRIDNDETGTITKEQLCGLLDKVSLVILMDQLTMKHILRKY